MAPKFMKENGLQHVTFSTADGALEAAPAVSLIYLLETNCFIFKTMRWSTKSATTFLFQFPMGFSFSDDINFPRFSSSLIHGYIFSTP